VARLLALAASGLLLSACFGKVAIGVSQAIEPTPILPGASVRQEVNVEADGILGNAVKQSMTQAATTEKSPQSGTKWEIRDNSEGSTVRVRMFRTVGLAEAQGRVAENSTSGFDVGTLEVRQDDWIVARRYTIRVVVSPSRTTPSTPSSSDPASQQLAQALLAGITYDYYLTMPGIVTATNGAPGDQSRLTWHLDISSSAERVMTAESIYPDWPRVLFALVLAGAGVLGFTFWRRRSAAPAEPAEPTLV
jgi:hypothetical protein